jgi:acetyl esterase
VPLDPQAKALLDQIAAMGGPTITEMSVPDARATLAAFAAMAGPGPEVASVADRAADGPAGAVPVRVYTPHGSPPFPVVVWFHGGGWVLGSIEEHETVCRQLCEGAGAVVVSVGYRLAPEHRFPAAAEDCYAATVWAAAHAAELGGDAGRLAVAGDSAGGNLAAVVALMARDRGGPPLRFQLLVYPVTDGTMGSSSMRENGEGYFLTAEAMRWFWDHYAPDPADRSNPYAAPLAAADLAGLPPALVITAEFDPLRDEGETYGARLREAGVPVAVSRYDGMIHGFFTSGALFDAAGKAVAEASAALRAALAS